MPVVVFLVQKSGVGLALSLGGGTQLLVPWTRGLMAWQSQGRAEPG